MSCYFTTDRYNIVTRLTMRDAAVRCLETSHIYDLPSCCDHVSVYVEELGGGLYRLVPEWNPFSGNWGNSGPEELIEEFLKVYCEPGSYISQRCDDYFEYGIYWMHGERKVESRWEGYSNPFDALMDELEEGR